jgi:hypothetical protein
MNEISSGTNDQSAAPNSVTGQPQYKGVNGWLLIFCIAQTILNPILLLRSLVSLVSVWYRHFQQFEQIPGLLTYTVVDRLLLLGVTAFSVYAGERLWRIKLGAVKIVKRYLLTVLGYYFLSLFLPFIVEFSSTASDKLFLSNLARLVLGATFVALWYSYFNQSKRVKATYGA